ncbi:MAG TPA: TlpA disulfide reductase family protein [Steroidobacteraceae bacterium]|nr:TlpA disulfide reductase family protein [Steroidobacteraceae bacterium]
MRIFLTRILPAALIIIAAGLGGFFAYGYVAKPRTFMAAAPLPTAAQTANAAATSVRAPAATSAAPSPDAGAAPGMIPQTLPDIVFADQTGATRHLTDWKGHPLLVNFWAPWCSPCREEIPLLERLSRDRARDGLRVVGIAVDSRAAVLDYARRAAIPYPLLIGREQGLEAVQALGLQAVFPFSVFVDARGRIVTLKIGALRADQATLILDHLHELDQGRLDLATARQEIADGMAKLGVAHAQAATGARL